MKYTVEFTDAKTGAISPIDTITAPDGYTADDYIRDCRENADPEWIEMIESGTVTLTEIEDVHYITAESFGSDCPSNWEDIAGALNAIIDERNIADDRDAVDALWESYCSGELANVPAPAED